jgi:DNA invertase Pin-like site-specific DNA recombinase
MPTASPVQTAGVALERAIGYVRVSTAKQVDGHSLEAQTAAIRAYCASRGLELVDIVVDAAESGRTPLAERDGGRRVLSAIYPDQDRVRVRRVARRADAIRHVVAT